MPGPRSGSTRCGRSWVLVQMSEPRGSGRMSRDKEVAAATREGQTLVGGSGLLLRHANLVRLPHTIFALPFALVGVVLASYLSPITWSAVVWVVIAFTSGRFAAIGLNRIAAREIDARNPGGRSREIP